MAPSAPPLRTALHARHVEAGAQMVPFAGFEMPLRYGSILAEHRAVRSSAGLFDVSHMGEIRLRGEGARAFAQRLFTNDATSLEAGRVRYGLLCREDGGIVDDVTLFCTGPDDFLFCVNAANIAQDREWILELRERTGARCKVLDESETTALLAIQGPRARDIAHAVLPPGAPRPGRWRFAQVEVVGQTAWLSRTGYTGEDGYEIFLPASGAVALWDALLGAGGTALARAGLGARDTLRTEMGYALYGHEIDLAHDPLEAGLERFIAWGAGFIGEEALARARERGPARCLVGLALEGRQAARAGYPIHTDEGEGVVTSGIFGPSVERSIAMGYVPARCARLGTGVEVGIRGRRVAARVVETPFLARGET